MTGKKVVLVTGVAGYWGGRLATQLVTQSDLHVIGLDSERPKQEIKDLDFIQADIRNPLLVELLKGEAVHTVCHLAFNKSAVLSEAAFELNVLGTMKVFGACAEAGVKKIVLRGTTAVYGALPNNSAFLKEEHPLNGSRSNGYIRDMIEVEAFCNGFRRQSPEVMLTLLRFSSIVGPNADTPMTRFLKEQWTPVLLGFDPLFQVIHENDVVDALVFAVVNDTPGVFNVAAEGILPLRKLMSLAGKMSLPVFHLFAYWGTGLMGSIGKRVINYTPIELDYIRYPWVGDLRRMREEMGFTPHYTAEEAVREFAGYQRMAGYMPEAASLAYDEERLRDTLERRRRSHLHKPAAPPEEGDDRKVSQADIDTEAAAQTESEGVIS